LSAISLPSTPTVWLLLLLSAGFPAEAAESEFRSLAESMSHAEFSRAGLDKLSAQEMAALDAWIRQLTAPALADQAPPLAAPAASAASAANKTANQLAEAEAAARAAESEAAAALAAATAAEAEARAQAEAAAARQAAAEARSAEAAEQAARAEHAALAEAERANELSDQPFQNGRWVGPKPDRVEGRIDGDFEGWRGDTLFVLDNGEIWKQRKNGKYFFKKSAPEVVITRNILGFFDLEVVETGKSIGVKRVR